MGRSYLAGWKGSRLSEQIERLAILAELNAMAGRGLRSALRRLPPPGGGWLVHVKEADLQELSDQKREDLLIELVQKLKVLRTNGIPVGIVRTLE